jgi:activating signal cointegrator complex subunit 3
MIYVLRLVQVSFVVFRFSEYSNLPCLSGKTAVAELAILRMKARDPKGICVYIAPMKALARERLKEWRSRLGTAPLLWSVLELSGDTHHDLGVLEKADVLVCTPEKWDLISRGWRGSSGKGFIKRVRLLVMDEGKLHASPRSHLTKHFLSSLCTQYICWAKIVARYLKRLSAEQDSYLAIYSSRSAKAK